MNNRQFFSTGFCNLISKMPAFYKKWNKWFNAFVPKTPFFQKWNNYIENTDYLKTYFFLFIILFAVQALSTYVDNVFFWDYNPQTKTFCEDIVNVINYTMLCEFYIIIGLIFLKKLFRLESELKRNKIFSENHNAPVSFKGIGIIPNSIIFITSLSVLLGYFNESAKYKSTFWFYSVPKFSFTGIYYALVTLFLMSFIVFVGLNHFGIFAYSMEICIKLHKLMKKKENYDLDFWLEESKLREKLAPFCNLLIYSKTFVLLMALNVFTWKANIQTKSLMIDISIPVITIVGIWVFSLPRYFVQLHLYKLSEQKGLHNYFDIRKPWNQGLSGIIDTALTILLIQDKFEFAKDVLMGLIV